jgi:anti-anti-sigma factor
VNVIFRSPWQRWPVAVETRKVDSTVIRMLLQERERLSKSGSEIRLLITSSTIRRLFELTGLDDFFQIDASLHPPIEG